MDKIQELINQVNKADAVIVGAGSGMSNAAGMDFWYEASPLFMKYMKDFYDKYHFEGLFKGFYNHFDTLAEKYTFLIRLGHINATVPPQKPTYKYLQTLLKNKAVHIITTNQDGIFKRFFQKDQISEIQGSWEYWQSSNPETDKKLYPFVPILKKLLPKALNGELNDEDIPRSDVDNSPLIPWVRGPEFLEDKKYYEEYQKVNKFLAKHRGEKILFLEMGVGRMTPMFIQEPFWEMTHYLKNSFYININPKDAMTNQVIKDRSLLIGDDINEVLKQAATRIGGKNND